MKDNNFTCAVNMPILNNKLVKLTPQQAHLKLIKDLGMNVNTPSKVWFNDDHNAHRLFNTECNEVYNTGVGVVSHEEIRGNASKPINYTLVTLHTGQRVAWQDDGINLIRTIIG
jgi:hypothetical protein